MKLSTKVAFESEMCEALFTSKEQAIAFEYTKVAHTRALPGGIHIERNIQCQPLNNSSGEDLKRSECAAAILHVRS